MCQARCAEYVVAGAESCGVQGKEMFLSVLLAVTSSSFVPGVLHSVFASNM